ncbi:signal peptide peptidase SppA [Candidatus Mycalebacterium sp.]
MRFRYIIAALILLGAIVVLVEETTDKIAVLNIEGVIISSGAYTEAVREIEKNGSYKALVVRIDSPGGSVAASQEIYALVKRLGQKIPVVASMGNVAASGGYYIACGAPHIIANPGTITGSIGVLATFANYGELLRWAKIGVDVVKTGELKDAGSPLRPLEPGERKYLQDLVDNALEQFKNTVVENREISPEKMKEFSDGRIVLGSEAMESGLVDEMGTFLSAIETAAERAGIPKDSPVHTFPVKDLTFLDLIIPGESAKLLGKYLSPSVFHGAGLYYMSEQFGQVKTSN